MSRPFSIRPNRDEITPVVIARIRRGKYIRIPTEWRGKVTDEQTIRKRQSKLTRKRKNATKATYRKGGFYSPRERDEARAPREEEYDI